MINLLFAVCEQLSVWGHEQTADFKREKTANFEKETKPANLKKESNDLFCIKEQLAGKKFPWEKNVYAYLSSNGD